jgi:hypothetical protein
MKKNKTAAPAANAKTNNGSNVEVVQVDQLKNIANSTASGLDANHQVDLLKGLQTYFHDDPKTKAKVGNETCEKMDEIIMIGYATVLAIEVETGTSQFATRMSATQLEGIKKVMPLLGVKINTALLPPADTEGNVEVPSTAVEVSPEAKKKIKKEKKAKESAITDPTKIETVEQLSDSLTAILCKTSTPPYERMRNAAEFLRAYQTITANKLADADEKKAKLAEIKAKSISDLLEEVRTTIGECTFTSVGLCHYIYNSLVSEGNVVYPFTLLYRASRNKKTGKALQDTTIAAIIKTLVNWECDERIKKYTADIERKKKTTKDAKVLANLIKPVEDNVLYCTNVANLVNNPSFDDVDNLVENFNSEDAKKKANAKKIIGCICDLWMPDVKHDELSSNPEKDVILEKVKKRAGVIVNSFLNPLEQNIAYKEDINEPDKADDKKEDESKN